MKIVVTPAATGRQLVRASLPVPEGWLPDGAWECGLRVSSGKSRGAGSARAVAVGRWPVRRAIVTFAWTFRDTRPVRFVLTPTREETRPAMALPGVVSETGLELTLPGGGIVRARWVAPPRTESRSGHEPVERNADYAWSRHSFFDPRWPRRVEWRVDALGGVALVLHLQKRDPADGPWAPEFGWRVDAMPEGYRAEFPTAPFQPKRVVVRAGDTPSILSPAGARVPMQVGSWRRIEVALLPEGLAAPTPALLSPHRVEAEPSRWRDAYGIAPLPQLPPDLARLVAYHRDAVASSAASGDDWGNVTGFNPGQPHGPVLGMNRLNHCAPIFEDGWRSGDRRLVETAVLWCENFHDLSLWWGDGQTGGTRYNNVRAQGVVPPTADFMWRSNDAVSFCTKGVDAFLYAWEETGDPRMREALEAQTAYAAAHLHAGEGTTRNVGDVRDFLRLHRATGEERWRGEALRLFRELRAVLSTGDLFTEGGQPIDPDPPFIDDDSQGYRHPFAKPYILGYALSGLPELARHCPREPKLAAVVSAVADFMAAHLDPAGGWRYPHPRSRLVLANQAPEHAWQLCQAIRWGKPEGAHLDAVETVLRARLHGFLRTGRIFASLTPWESVAGAGASYARPSDRDPSRDWSEGRPEFGGCPPEGLVYLPEILTLYLAHRPAARLLAPPTPQSPLGKVLARAPKG